MKDSIKTEVCNGLEALIANLPSNSSKRNALYDINLLHHQAQIASKSILALVQDRDNSDILGEYLGSASTFITIPRWVQEDTEAWEVPQTAREHLKKVRNLVDLIEKLEAPILNRKSNDPILADKISSLWMTVEKEMLECLIKTIKHWNIQGQMQTFNKNTAVYYVRHLLNTRDNVQTGRLKFVHHFIDTFYENVSLVS